MISMPEKRRISAGQVVDRFSTTYFTICVHLLSMFKPA